MERFYPLLFHIGLLFLLYPSNIVLPFSLPPPLIFYTETSQRVSQKFRTKLLYALFPYSVGAKWKERKAYRENEKVKFNCNRTYATLQSFSFLTLYSPFIKGEVNLHITLEKCLSISPLCWCPVLSFSGDSEFQVIIKDVRGYQERRKRREVQLEQGGHKNFSLTCGRPSLCTLEFFFISQDQGNTIQQVQVIMVEHTGGISLLHSL